jgi:hypothetical protein
LENNGEIFQKLNQVMTMLRRVMKMMLMIATTKIQVPNLRKQIVPYERCSILDNVIEDQIVTSALDITHTTQRGATVLLGSFAVAAKMDFGEASFSRSTIERKRSKSRKKIAEKIKNDFLLTPKSNLVVHWDGKLLENFTNTANTDEKVERIAVAVTGMEVSKILGIPKAISGTGAAQADIVFNLLKEWDLVDCIIGMSFDTTSSNTGIRNGACVILERLLGKKLLYLACRHHILELVVENVFKIYFGATTSPEVKFFNDLKKNLARYRKKRI